MIHPELFSPLFTASSQNTRLQLPGQTAFLLLFFFFLKRPEINDEWTFVAASSLTVHRLTKLLETGKIFYHDNQTWSRSPAGACAPAVGEQVDIVAVALREIDGECSLTVATLGRDSWAVRAHVSIFVHVCSLRGCALCRGAQRQGGCRAAPQEIRCRDEGWGGRGGAKGSRPFNVARH